MSLASETEPKTFQGLVGNGPVFARLADMTTFAQVPPMMIFDGPPGLGKTTSARCLARQMQPPVEVRVVGASIYRTRRELAEIVKWMVRPSHKILFFDEVDSMDHAAQLTLVELSHRTRHCCKIVMACNTLEKVERRVRSEAVYFRYLPVPTDEVAKYIEQVARDRNLYQDDIDYHWLAETAEGDMRKAVESLVSGEVKSDKVVHNFLQAVRKGEFTAHMADQMTTQHAKRAATKMTASELASFTMWYANREKKPLMF